VRLLLLGPPGSGKGTQGPRLAQAYGVPHVATGDLIRDHIARGTKFGRKVEAAIAQGNFAPDADIIYWVRRRLAQSDAQRGYVLDGFPRDLAQAQAFDAQSPGGRGFDVAIELLISEPILIARLAGRLVCPQCDRVYHGTARPPLRPGLCDADGALLMRRPDDAPEAIRHRLEIYETVTLPLRGYYAAEGLLLPVDASDDPDLVYQRIQSAVDAFVHVHENAAAKV
jgi:adenylate kinase